MVSDFTEDTLIAANEQMRPCVADLSSMPSNAWYTGLKHREENRLLGHIRIVDFGFDARFGIELPQPRACFSSLLRCFQYVRILSSQRLIRRAHAAGACRVGTAGQTLIRDRDASAACDSAVQEKDAASVGGKICYFTGTCADMPARFQYG